MGLRRLISISLLGTLAVLAVLMLAALRWDTQQQAARLEEVEARGDLRRLLATLQARTLEVNGVLKSWANWTELYRHLKKPDINFSRDELSAPALRVADMDLLALLDTQGNLVEMVEVPGPNGDKPATLQARQNASLYSAYFSRLDAKQGCGAVLAQQQLALVCFSPVLDSEGNGEPPGYVLMGRWVDDALLQEIAQQTGTQFRWVPVGDGVLPPPGHSLVGRMFQQEAVRVQQTEKSLELTYPVYSIFDSPIAQVQMSWPRKRAEEANRLYITTQALMIFLIVVCGLMLVLLLDRIVVRRLNRLRDELGAIVESRQWTGAVTVGGNDEVSALAGYAQKLIGVVRDQVEELKSLSQTDTLTGLPNRRAFNERVDYLVALHHRQQLDAALVLIDVDYFKKYNDVYGHPAGDEALKMVARCLRSSLRRELDLPVRLGGEEFGVLLQGVGLKQATVAAESIRNAMQAMAIVHEANQPLGVMTVSLGVAAVEPRDTTTTLYRRADEALYQAKAGGRNQVVAK